MEVTSNTKQLTYPQEMVYNVLSNPRKLEEMLAKLPEEKKNLKGNVQFGDDSITMDVPSAGEITLNITEREKPKTIKFEATIVMVTGNLWINILPATETTSNMELIIKADIPFFMKGMVAKPLQDGINKVADMLASLPYDKF